MPVYNRRTLSPVLNEDVVTKTVTLSLDTSAYASGDVLADTQEIADAMFTPGGTGEIQSINVLDKDDQGVEIDLVFLKTNVALGTENAAPAITDTNAAQILGIVNVPAASQIDFGGARLATVKEIDLPVSAASGSKSIFVAAVTRGTPTHTAAGIVLYVTIRRN
jgi:hypothetical protein